MDASDAPEQRLASLSDTAVMTQLSWPTGTNPRNGGQPLPFSFIGELRCPTSLTPAASRALVELCAVDAPCGLPWIAPHGPCNPVIRAPIPGRSLLTTSQGPSLCPSPGLSQHGFPADTDCDHSHHWHRLTPPLSHLGLVSAGIDAVWLPSLARSGAFLSTS